MFTIFREPISRTLSTYVYCSNHHTFDKAVCDVELFKGSQNRSACDFAKYFGGYTLATLTDLVTRAPLVGSIEAMQFRDAIADGVPPPRWHLALQSNSSGTWNSSILPPAPDSLDALLRNYGLGQCHAHKFKEQLKRFRFPLFAHLTALQRCGLTNTSTPDGRKLLDRVKARLREGAFRVVGIYENFTESVGVLSDALGCSAAWPKMMHDDHVASSDRAQVEQIRVAAAQSLGRCSRSLRRGHQASDVELYDEALRYFRQTRLRGLPCMRSQGRARWSPA
jgi:hypothetical protein